MIREGVEHALMNRNKPVFDFLAYKLEKPLDLTEIIQGDNECAKYTRKLLKIVKEHIGKNSKGLIKVDLTEIIGYFGCLEDSEESYDEVKFFIEYVGDLEGEFDYNKYIDILVDLDCHLALGYVVDYGIRQGQLKVVQVRDVADPAAEGSDVDV